MLRLAGLIAFLILAVVLLVVLVRGCASSSKHDKYESYMPGRPRDREPLRPDRQGPERSPGGDRHQGDRARGEDQRARSAGAAGGRAGPQLEPARARSASSTTT